MRTALCFTGLQTIFQAFLSGFLFKENFQKINESPLHFRGRNIPDCFRLRLSEHTHKRSERLISRFADDVRPSLLPDHSFGKPIVPNDPQPKTHTSTHPGMKLPE
ncbi:hypothetical protein D3C80_1881990 [compost metagenome]